MVSEVLGYDNATRQFIFPARAGEPKIPHMGMMVLRDGRLHCFRDTWPAAWLGLKEVKNRRPGMKATPEAIQHIQRIKSVQEELDAMAFVERYRELFRREPYKHQERAVEALLRFERIGLLFEQGMGKTFIALMALELLKAMGEPYRAVVVCPRNVVGVWQREAATCTSLRVATYFGEQKTRHAVRQAMEGARHENWDILLTTFDLLTDGTDRLPLPAEVVGSWWMEHSQDWRKRFLSQCHDLKVAENRKSLLLSDKTDTKTLAACGATLGRYFAVAKAVTTPADLCGLIKNYANAELFRNVPLDVLVVDEASRVVNWESARSKAVEALAYRSKRAWLLSGTLCLGRPTDMYEPLTILDERILDMSWKSFKRTFCITDKNTHRIVLGYRNLDKLKLMAEPYLLSMKRDEALDMPDRVLEQRWYQLPETSRKLYNAIVEQDVVEVDGEPLVTVLPVVKIIKCMQLLSGHLTLGGVGGKACADCDKVVSCVTAGISPGRKGCTKPGAVPEKCRVVHFDKPKLEMLEDDLEICQTEKVIIWAWFRNDLDDIANLLKRKEIPFVTPETPNSDALFEKDERLRVYLGQTVQGIGITLNSATCTIYYSHGTALEPRQQSMDRNYRIGQTRPVLVRDYVCPGSIEEDIVLLLEHKKDVQTFMQSGSPCLACDSLSECLRDGTQAYSETCIHFDQREDAERKHALRMRLLKNTSKN